MSIVMYTSMEYCQKHLLDFGAIFQPLLSLWSGQSTSKGGHQSFLGKSLPSQVRKRIGTNQTYLESLHKSWVSLGSLGPFQPAERQVSMDC